MRVIAGTARGRPLRAPRAATTRPTADKIKGVIFSMLDAEAMRRGHEPDPGDDERDGRFASAVAWPRVLELYAGSGALSIEALSRGAERADLVESSGDARRAIEANLDKTGFADRARVHAMRSEAVPAALRGPYDLLMLDPPYDATGVDHLLGNLVARALLAPGSVVAWEHAADVRPPAIIDGGPRALRLLKTNTHGSASVSLYALTAEPVGGMP
jgi:16S rRNA (guanine966-N2)-methyltransferase